MIGDNAADVCVTSTRAPQILHVPNMPPDAPLMLFLFMRHTCHFVCRTCHVIPCRSGRIQDAQQQQQAGRARRAHIHVHTHRVVTSRASAISGSHLRDCACRHHLTRAGSGPAGECAPTDRAASRPDCATFDRYSQGHVTTPPLPSSPMTTRRRRAAASRCR